MVTYKPPAPTYIKARWYGPSSNKPIKRIVMHGTTGANSTRPGYARLIARYFSTTDRKASAHYAVDPEEVIQCVLDSYVAYHDGTNDNSLAVELCDPVEGPLSRWDEAPSRQMLRRAARLVAELCLAYDVPPRYVGTVGLRIGRKGITTHNGMRLAFPGSTSHWDPGKWPRRRFMRLVRAEVEAITKGVEAPVDPPKPTRVTQAGVLIDQALDLLASVPVTRKRVHRTAAAIREQRGQLPER